MRKIQSFVKRSGRLTPSQKNALDNFNHPDNPFIVANLAQPFITDAPLILEIGFGNGDSLLAMAQNESEYNFIGVEVYDAGFGRLLNNLHLNKIPNLKILQLDGIEVLNQIPDNSLSGFQLYFPDPWHKKKHHKRRLINTGFLDLLAKKLKTKAFVHLATDWQDYAEQMLEVLTQHPDFINTSAGDFSNKPERRPTTKFEKRGLKLGHGVWDLVWIKSN